MGKHFLNKQYDEESEYSHPGCMCGIFHALDYHHWNYNVKNMLLHKKHEKRRHVKCNRSPIINLNNHDQVEVQNLLEDESGEPYNGKSSIKSKSTSKKSLKARSKALTAEEISKNEDFKRGKGVSVQPRLQRTFSIHHLEPTDVNLDEICAKWNHRIILVQNKGKTNSVIQKGTMQSEGNDKLANHGECFDDHHIESHTIYQDDGARVNEPSQDQYVKDAGILEIFKVNKALFLKILQNTEKGIADGSQAPRTFNVKARLTRSGSFPMADFGKSRNFKTSNLKHKQNEIWSFRKKESLLNDCQATKLAGLKFSQTLRTNSAPLMTDVDGRNIAFTDSTQELDKEKNGQVEGMAAEWCNNEMSADGKNGSISFHETGASVCDLNKNTLDGHRRTSSLNESIGKYSRLFENCSNIEANWPLSKSLKLTNDNETPSFGQGSAYFRRIFSLPHLDSYFPSSNELQQVANCSGKSLCTSNSSTNIVYETKIDNEETRCLNAEEAKLSNSTSTMEYTVSLKASISDENNSTESIKGFFQSSPVLVLESYSEEKVGHTSNSELGGMEDTERVCNYLDMEELPSVSSFCSSTNSPDIEKTKTSVEHNMQNLSKDEDLTYVREILVKSGFLKKCLLETWNPSYKPLDPSVFVELESCWPHELEYSEENVYSCNHHLLLFDLVDEVLLQIHDRSFTYYPKTLSCTCHIRPIPMRNRLLEEVLGIVGKYFRLRLLKPELEQSIDCIVAQDLEKDDGWMNLQLESECVALDVEDVIFDQLLEEVICQ